MSFIDFYKYILNSTKLYFKSKNAFDYISKVKLKEVLIYNFIILWIFTLLRIIIDKNYIQNILQSLLLFLTLFIFWVFNHLLLKKFWSTQKFEINQKYYLSLVPFNLIIIILALLALIISQYIFFSNFSLIWMKWEDIYIMLHLLPIIVLLIGIIISVLQIPIIIWLFSVYIYVFSSLNKISKVKLIIINLIFSVIILGFVWIGILKNNYINNRNEVINNNELIAKLPDPSVVEFEELIKNYKTTDFLEFNEYDVNEVKLSWRVRDPKKFPIIINRLYILNNDLVCEVVNIEKKFITSKIVLNIENKCNFEDKYNYKFLVLTNKWYSYETLTKMTNFNKIIEGSKNDSRLRISGFNKNEVKIKKFTDERIFIKKLYILENDYVCETIDISLIQNPKIQSIPIKNKCNFKPNTKYNFIIFSNKGYFNSVLTNSNLN